MLDNIITLGFLVLLQAVLGFDNLLYVSLESKRAPAEKRKFVRQIGIGGAIFLRIALLFILINLIDLVQEPVFSPHVGEVFHGSFNIHSLIVLAGGIFILYTAVKEIWHMLAIDVAHEAANVEADQKSVGKAIAMIMVMNLVFSFDSILSAMALTDVFWVMATAIIIGGILMIVLADHVATFLQKNRMFEVLGLFVLFIVGVMLIGEGGHLAHMTFLGTEVVPMSKGTFYFVIGILVVIDLVQTRYQKNLIATGQLSFDTGDNTPQTHG